MAENRIIDFVELKTKVFIDSEDYRILVKKAEADGLNINFVIGGLIHGYCESKRKGLL